MNANLFAIYDALLDGDVTGMQNGVQTALAADLNPGDILGKA